MFLTIEIPETKEEARFELIDISFIVDEKEPTYLTAYLKFQTITGTVCYPAIYSAICQFPYNNETAQVIL
jgi:hypothetical protein